MVTIVPTSLSIERLKHALPPEDSVWRQDPLAAAKAFIPSPGFETPLGEDAARERVQDIYADDQDVGTKGFDLFFGPAEGEVGAALVGGSVVAGPIAKIGGRVLAPTTKAVSRFGDEILPVLRVGGDEAGGAATKTGSFFRTADGQLRFGRVAGATGGGLFATEVAFPGAVTDRFDAASDRVSDAAEDTAGSVVEAVLELVESAFKGGAKGAFAAPIGLLLVGGTVVVGLLVWTGVIGSD